MPKSSSRRFDKFAQKLEGIAEDVESSGRMAMVPPGTSRGSPAVCEVVAEQVEVRAGKPRSSTR
jgi:hypothetical protein